MDFLRALLCVDLTGGNFIFAREDYLLSAYNCQFDDARKLGSISFTITIQLPSLLST